MNCEIADLGPIRRTRLLRLCGHQNIAAALRHHARDTDRPINVFLVA